MDKKVVVIYKTKYGSTKRYAGWIALRLGADLYEVSDIRGKDLENYDVIVYGGGVYVGKVNGINFIVKNYDKIKSKKIIIFTVGMESIKENLNKSILEKNFSIDEIKNIKIFNFRGGFNYNTLTLLDKVLMKGLKSSISKKSNCDLTEDDKIILEGFEKEIDLCNKKSIDLLVESI